MAASRPTRATLMDEVAQLRRWLAASHAEIRRLMTYVKVAEAEAAVAEWEAQELRERLTGFRYKVADEPAGPVAAAILAQVRAGSPSAAAAAHP